MGKGNLVAKNETVRNGVVKKKKEDKPKQQLLQTSLASTKILIPLLGDDVAPRFDLAPEAFIAVIGADRAISEDRTIILTHASAEALCNLILTEKVNMVICCGIEEEYYEYLRWKKVKVIDSVMGPYTKVLERARSGTVSEGDVFIENLRRPFSVKKG
jgi:predicted Fe-Mo cluster-binding NifX family protein